MTAQDISTKRLKAEITGVHEERGLHTARGVKATLSAAWSHAMRTRDDVKHNPFAKLKMETPKERWRAGSIAEMETLIRAADLIGRPDVGDAIVMGLMTGQRQADRINEMTEAGRTDDGRILIRQGKRGAVVALPEDPRVVARLAAGRARREAWKVKPLALLVDEQLRKPWSADRYRKIFAVARATAVAGIPAHGYHLAGQDDDGRNTLPADPRVPAHWQLQPCPSLADFHDQDLRDTAVTWLALAGATIPEICAVTGHSLQSATSVLKHYLGQHPDLARSALRHLGIWLDERGAGF
jgi:hypothetical protein